MNISSRWKKRRKKRIMRGCGGIGNPTAFLQHRCHLDTDASGICPAQGSGSGCQVDLSLFGFPGVMEIRGRKDPHATGELTLLAFSLPSFLAIPVINAFLIYFSLLGRFLLSQCYIASGLFSVTVMSQAARWKECGAHFVWKGGGQ